MPTKNKTRVIIFYHKDQPEQKVVAVCPRNGNDFVSQLPYIVDGKIHTKEHVFSKETLDARFGSGDFVLWDEY